jgi:predicted membrane protein
MDGELQVSDNFFARVGYASRCLTALLFGGLIPLAAALAAAAARSGAASTPGLGALTAILVLAAVAAVVFAGAVGLRALERSWAAFAAYLASVGFCVQLIALAARV